MNHAHNSKFALGIYGDGQLARLLAQSALREKLSVLIFTLNEKDSPCKGLAPLQQGKSWTDKESFKKFCQRCDNVVLENEFVPAEFLKELESPSLKFFPNADSYFQVSNKLKQVELAQALGIHIPEFRVVEDASQLESLKLPCMLKSLNGGYDGYGNFTFKEISQLPAAKVFIQSRGPALAQEFLFFDQEVAVVIARDGKETFSFPVVETIQENNICHFVLTPPRFSENIQHQVQNQAMKLIQAIGGVGVFGLEFFIQGETVIFNEIAPRTHNSGHFSIEACSYSQFDALIKLLKGEKLSPPLLTSPAAAMLNLLGTQNGKAQFEGDRDFTHLPQGFLHLYGKEDSRIGRKMGHFTLLGDNQQSLLKKLGELKTRYSL